MIQQNSKNVSTEKDFVISDYVEFLTPSDIPSRRKEKKYVCPNCGEHHLSIGKNGHSYSCFNCAPNPSYSCATSKENRNKIASALKKEWWAKYGEKTERKVIKPKQERTWTYTSEGKPYIKVKRVDLGNGERPSFTQYRYENEKWLSRLGKTHFQSKADLLYLDEVKRAIASNELIFVTEGEGCVESLRELGLTATCNIGGSGKNYQAYEILKDYPNIVLCPDKDTPGINHMSEIEKILNHKPMWLYVYPQRFWNSLPSSGGVDIADFIQEKRTDDKLTNEKIKEVIMAMIGDKKRFGEVKKTEGKVINFPSKPIDKDDIQSKLSELLEKGLKPSQETLELVEIAKDSGIHVNEIKDIYRSLKDENESKELTIDLSEKLENILDIENINLNLPSVLPQEIASKIIALSQKMKVAPEHLLTAMLPTWASMIGTKSKIVISSAMGYTQPSILRTMIVANSGDRKSPILKNATSAIAEMDAEEMEKYQEELKQYQEELKEWELLSKDEKKDNPQPEKPIAKRFMLDDCNYEGLVKRHTENPFGLFVRNDELVSYFNRMNKQHGKGDDEQKDLQLFNGEALIKDRQSENLCFYLPKSAVSLSGTIQWDVLRDLIKSKGENDSSGVVCRWLMCAKPLGISKLDLFVKDDGLFDLVKTEQKELLRYLRGISEKDYLLSDSAKKLWQEFQHHLEDLRAVETIDALSVAYPKFESYMSRLALILHCVESFYTRTLPATISGKTMKRAIEMTQFYMSQYRYVLAKCSPSQSLTGDILKIRDLLNKMGSLTVSQVRDKFRHLKSKPANERKIIILSYFETLVNSGFAQWEIVGKKIGTNWDKSWDKLGQTQKPPQSININTSEDTKKSKLGQIGTKLGHLKTNNINGLETELGQNNNFNFFSEDIEIQETEENNSTSVKEGSQENKIDSRGKCPNNVLESNNDNGLERPNFVPICPNETLKPSQDNTLERPNFCPNFDENVPTSEKLKRVFELGQILGYDFEILKSVASDFFSTDLSKLNDSQLKEFENELSYRAKTRNLI